MHGWITNGSHISHTVSHKYVTGWVTYVWGQSQIDYIWITDGSHMSRPWVTEWVTDESHLSHRLGYEYVTHFQMDHRWITGWVVDRCSDESQMDHSHRWITIWVTQWLQFSMQHFSHFSLNLPISDPFRIRPHFGYEKFLWIFFKISLKNIQKFKHFGKIFCTSFLHSFKMLPKFPQKLCQIFFKIFCQISVKLLWIWLYPIRW